MATITGLSIGDVTQRAGLSVHILRSYEREGLLPQAIPRDANDRRGYDENHIGWIDFCTKLGRACRFHGFTATSTWSDPVRATRPNGSRCCANIKPRVDAQLAALTASHTAITYKVGVYEERLAEGTASRLWSTESTEE